MKRIILSIMIIAAVAAFSIGCSQKDIVDNNASSDEAAVNNKPEQLIEPCQLISKTEAEELIGESMLDAEKSENEVVGLKLCFYESLAEESDRFLQVSLTQQAFMPEGDLTPKFLFESIKENFEDELMILDGIGEEAFIATPGIHILSGDYYIEIGVGNTSDDANIEILKKAGKKAVDNLEFLVNK